MHPAEALRAAPREPGKTMALAMARERLAGADLSACAHLVGLGGTTGPDGLVFRAFGRDHVLAPGPEVRLASGEPARVGDAILVLHLLAHDRPVAPGGGLVSFAELPGGQFYWTPFRSRTAIPLLRRIGNDTDLLRRSLDRFDWTPAKAGDFGARVHALGPFHVTLGFHRGDEEFEPALDVLFDTPLKDVFCAEDAAYLASRVCLGLL